MPGKIFIVDPKTNSRVELDRTNSEQIQAYFGKDFHWYEGIIKDHKDMKNISKLLEFATCTQPNMELFYTEPYGWRVRLLEPVLKGQGVTFYAGEYIDTALPGMKYQFITGTIADIAHGHEKFGSINAQSYGNVARFFEHAPSSKEEMYKWYRPLPSSGVDSSTVVLNNLRPTAVSYSNTKQVIFLAVEDLAAGSILAYDYGIKNYWEKLGITPELSFKDGTIVPRIAYAPVTLLITATHRTLGCVVNLETSYLQMLEDFGWDKTEKKFKTPPKYSFFNVEKELGISAVISGSELLKKVLTRRFIIKVDFEQFYSVKRGEFLSDGFVHEYMKSISNPTVDTAPRPTAAVVSDSKPQAIVPSSAERAQKTKMRPYK